METTAQKTSHGSKSRAALKQKGQEHREV